MTVELKAKHLDRERRKPDSQTAPARKREYGTLASATATASRAAHELLDKLVTNAPPRYREFEAAKARAARPLSNRLLVKCGPLRQVVDIDVDEHIHRLPLVGDGPRRCLRFRASGTGLRLLLIVLCQGARRRYGRVLRRNEIPSGLGFPREPVPHRAASVQPHCRHAHQ